MKHTLNVSWLAWMALSLALPLISGCTSVPSNNTSMVEIDVAVPLDEWKQQAKYTHINGHRIAYWDDGQGEPLVLIHGFPSSAWDWQHIRPELEKHYRVIAADLLGYGLSDKPWPHQYSMYEQADIVLGVVKHLGISKFHLMAHDYGDSVAQEILARHNEQQVPGFLESLVLLNGGLFPETQQHTVGMHLLKSPLGPYLVHIYSKWKFDRDLSAVFGEYTKPNQAQLDGFWQLVNHNNGLQAFPGIIQYIDERWEHGNRWVTALKETEIPLLLINGIEDNISGGHMADNYEQQIPNPDIVRLKGIGHFPQLEAPQLVVDSYLDFRHQL